MTIHTKYKFTVDYYSQVGDRIGTVAIRPDWEPALEYTQFLGIRRGALDPLTALPGGAIEPVWADGTNGPSVAAIRAVIAGSDQSEDITCEIPRSYFRRAAEAGSSKLVQQGSLQPGEKFTYVVSAFDGAESANATADPAVGVQPLTESLEFEDREISDYLRCSQPVNGDVANADDVPVFLPEQVIAETLECSQAAGDLETGGVLIGKLRRASDANDIFVDITAQIPALHTESRSAKLTFTPETWAAVTRVIELRGRNELMLGWWHLHPNWCAKCPPESQALCPLRRDFFSDDDVHLHRTCFPRAYQFAMLVSDHGERGLSTSYHGWRRGMVSARSVNVIGPGENALN